MRYINVIILFVCGILFSACHPHDEFEDDAYGNFDALWKIIDEHYCFFAEKDIDWNSVGKKYKDRIEPGITVNEYFNICSEMLNELQDGHVNLVSSFNQSYYRNWWTDYPQDFSLRTLQQYYLNFDYRTTSGIIYKVLDDNIGYLYYPSFSNTVGETNLDYILSWFQDCKALIIDVRNNGGGNMTNIDRYVARFIETPILGGYIRHKTGPGHSDFSEPYPIIYKPAPASRVHWYRPIAVLTNRSTYSAANDFVSVMKSLPNVTVIGAKSGGGGGLPFSYEIPIGWSVRLSTAPVSDANDLCIENGIEPSQGFALHSPEDELAKGKDAILDRALIYLSKFPNPEKK
ncbi:MAG: S41 family peptidase [Prevotella sp.]|nr:S41 family peptidase [Bacteroides sp.]MCM1366297.1 S41 family peptidase [Prevotella sp.]MCM1437101.1 S41 family peptidase [Prevotella sp.]